MFCTSNYYYNTGIKQNVLLVRAKYKVKNSYILNLLEQGKNAYIQVF